MMLAVVVVASAQNAGSNSPYSRYGMGLMNDRTGAARSAMAGAGLGMHGGTEINIANPASVAYTDSLTLLFDIGASLQNANLSENGSKVNARNMSLDYVLTAFRVTRNLGLSLGLLPYSTIGYKMTGERAMSSPMGEYMQYEAFEGDGGVHEVYAALGWKPFRRFALGFSAGYLWGDLNHSVITSFSDTDINLRRREYDSDIRTFKLDFGIQYEQRLNKNNSLTLGLTYGLGHDIHTDARLYDQTASGTTYIGDTIVVRNAYGLPHSVGVGLMWNYKDRLRLSGDYSLQMWGSTKSPALFNNSSSDFRAVKGLLKDRHTVHIGAEYVHNRNSYKWHNHIRYRAGISYSTPHFNVGANDGPSDFVASLGLGIPVINRHNSRTCVVNIGFQYERLAPKVSGMLKEQYLRVCLGISWGEQWFLKWRAQ